MENNADKLHKGDKAFWTAMIALGFAGIAAVAVAWWTTQQFAQRWAHDQVERQVDTWNHEVISMLTLGRDTFSYQNVGLDDKKVLHQLTMSTNVYRVVFFNKDGKIFWSTKADKIGKVENQPYFTDIVMKGERYRKAFVSQVSDIDGLLLRRPELENNPTAARQVTEVYVPVKQNGKFVGAMELYIDTTDMHTWHLANIESAGRILCAVLALLFVVTGILVFGYANGRRKALAKFAVAHDEALKAEAESREMAAQLQQVNEDVVKLNRDLEQNVKMLRDTQDELVRRGKLAQLGQLTATVAHEIRNPLGAVRTAAFLIQRKTQGQDLGIDKPLERINNGIVRCDNIITELLDFARTKALQTETVAIDDWLLRVVEEQKQQLPKEVAVKCEFGMAGEEVTFDTASMQRVIINLLSNASEAMVGKGNDPAEIHIENPEIVLSTKRTGRGVEICARDNGPGVSDDVMGKILEPLFTTKSFGVGLGLPAVEKILESHGGGLEIDGGHGKGAVFTAWFPTQQPAKEAA